MRRKKALKWMASSVLLTLALAVIIPGTGVAPPAQGPDSVACGDSITCSTAGNAVYVKNTGTGPSIYGQNTSTGEGLKGRGNPGVYGFSYHAAGVRGKSNQGVGVKGESVDKYGVHGIANGTSYGNAGVKGESFSADSFGVLGQAHATSGIAYGVRGETESPSGTGVYGLGAATSGNFYGVTGITWSTEGAGGYFRNVLGGNALYLEGDAAQTMDSNGLVKVAVAGWCALVPHWNCGISRSFNTLGGTNTVTPGASTGEFTVDVVST